MQLSLENIGKIKQAYIELNGITVIAGKNDTGKSTVSRALFAMCSGFYNIYDKVKIERSNTISTLVKRASSLIFNRSFSSTELQFQFDQSELLKILENNKNDQNLISDILIDTILANTDQSIIDRNKKDPVLKELLNKIANKICQVLSVSNDEVIKNIINKKLTSEFSGQLNNIFYNNQGKISLGQQSTRAITVTIVDNSVEDVYDIQDVELGTVYLDNPFMLNADDILFLNAFPSHSDHQSTLLRQLSNNNTQNTIEKILVNKKLNEVYANISSVCDGNMNFDKKTGNFTYKLKNSDKSLNVKNLSAGLKTFVILKTLLQNGSIEEGGTVILDEPEIHLHPEWQLLFAELIVLLHKHFSVNVLLTTHSPYFLEAIEVYAAKHEVNDSCKYYLASSQSQNDLAEIKDVSDNLELIYKELARPLQTLENERYSHD